MGWMTQVSISEWKAPGRRIGHCPNIHSPVDRPGRYWHLPAMPTTLAKLESISATTLTRLLLCSQQRCKEVSSATRSGKSQGEAPSLHNTHILTVLFFVNGFIVYRK